MNPVDVLSEIFGGDRQMASRLGVLQSSVSNWRRTGIPDGKRWRLRRLLLQTELPRNQRKRALAALECDLPNGEIQPSAAE